MSTATLLPSYQSPTRPFALGSAPLTPDYEVGRLLRDARLYTVGAGTQEIRRGLIGRMFNEAIKAGKDSL